MVFRTGDKKLATFIKGALQYKYMYKLVIFESWEKSSVSIDERPIQYIIQSLGFILKC